MAQRTLSCPLCALLGALGLVAGAGLLMWAGLAQAGHIRQTTETDAAARLSAAGYPWARLAIDGSTARLVGQAPDAASKTAAMTAAGEMFRPMMGVPGVFATLEDGVTARLEPLPTPTPKPPPAREVAAPAPAADTCAASLRDVLAKEKILFVTGSAQITAESHAVIDQLAEVARRCARYAIVVEGHTDSRGKDADNQRLSQRRAESVVMALRDRGVTDRQLRAEGFGESRPLKAGDSAAALAANRRIEFRVVGAN
jgi:outer membrane protein OmpA-like peptidoglycan-associated protein